MTNLSTASWVLLVIVCVIQVIYIFRKTSKADPVSVWILAASAVLLAIVFIQRSIEIGFVALTGTFESLVFYAAIIIIIDIVYRLQKKIPFYKNIYFLLAFVGLILLAIASSPLTSKEAVPPVPALRSFWLLLHVSFAFIGEAFFIVAFAASILFLLTKDSNKKIDFDRITYTSIAVGYPIFTAGAIIFGAIWAQKAWGQWWGWDPKETWALITWLVYTFYLHIRLIAKKSGALPSWISVAGFLCTIFTFFGVNYLLSGLHSYR
ncbi:MAG: cytochrome c biogenesis protein CcsA [Treponema sp.]|nr:cytochrome c biogenesis protein CcsA [Treponema sp.]